jgi:hypothetical protein
VVATVQVIVDLDGVLLIAQSEKEDAAATWKKPFGHHPLMGFVEHGSVGGGERSWACCGRATPAATPPPITSPRPRSRWRNCPNRIGGDDTR